MSHNCAARINGESFAEWHRKRKWARNIREGQPYFNGPPSVPPSERHSPSHLIQCHRKIVYRQENAPAEQAEPEGIFWTGRRFEEDVIVPYLRDLVHDEDVYVRTSLWIDLEVEADACPVRFKGATDPCLVDRQAKPLLPTEVKTKEEVDHLDGPNRHHRAQVHAYMRGLTAKYDRDVDEAVVIYGSRQTLDVRTFRVTFDPDFWQEIVEWAANHTGHRRVDELPPADPEYDWECRFCDYRHRCGEGESPYADRGLSGFLPGFEGYPRERVVEYLDTHDDAQLTPTLARKFPDLAESYDVKEWSCDRCEMAYSWSEIENGPDDADPPVCPRCAESDTLALLSLAEG